MPLWSNHLNPQHYFDRKREPTGKQQPAHRSAACFRIKSI